MSIEEKLSLLAETFEIDKSEISKDTVLTDLTCWDSMTKLSLIALMDDEFNKKLTGEQIRSFKTIGDILDFMERI